MVVFRQKWLYSGKVVVFGQSGFFWGKSVCIRKQWLCSGKMVVFGKMCCTRVKVFVIGQKLL